MSQLIGRSQTAEKVAELIGSEEGRQHLAQFGWAKGMPVVMAQPSDSFEDVIALASVHGRAVLLAMLEPVTGHLRLLHLSEPNSALQIVEPHKPETIIRVLFDEVQKSGMATFRIRYWQYSAVAHAVPRFESRRDGLARLYRNKTLSL